MRDNPPRAQQGREQGEICIQMFSKMLSKLAAVFRVPRAIHDEFHRMVCEKNTHSLGIVTGLILAAGALVIPKLLFFPSRALTEQDRRFYLAAYAVLMLAAVLYQALKRLTAQRSIEARLAVQCAYILCCFFWCILTNSFDLQVKEGAEAYIFASAMFGVSIFVYLPEIVNIVVPIVGYVVFMLLNVDTFSLHSSASISVTAFVAFGMSIMHFQHLKQELKQRNEIDKINKHLAELLKQDHMLKVLNKASMEERVHSELARAGRDCPVGLLLIDVDDFKSINDRYGHPCGDHVLTEIAARMKRVFSGANRYVGRVGGDEFSVLLTDLYDAEMLKELTARFLRELSDICWNGAPLPVSCSIGAVYIARERLAYREVYQKIDRLLYDVKQQGKSAYKFQAL